MAWQPGYLQNPTRGSSSCSYVSYWIHSKVEHTKSRISESDNDQVVNWTLCLLLIKRDKAREQRTCKNVIWRADYVLVSSYFGFDGLLYSSYLRKILYFWKNITQKQFSALSHCWIVYQLKRFHCHIKRILMAYGDGALFFIFGCCFHDNKQRHKTSIFTPCLRLYSIHDHLSGMRKLNGKRTPVHILLNLWVIIIFLNSLFRWK